MVLSGLFVLLVCVVCCTDAAWVKYPSSLWLRGGASSDEQVATKHKDLQVQVSTSYGTSFLDKKKKLTISSDSTVLELKRLLKSKFPGSPLVALQRLYLGPRLLQNQDILSNVTSSSSLTLLLDMISGSSSYNRTMSVTESIDAYVASVVHLSFVSDKFRLSAHPSVAPTENESPEAYAYRQLYESVNASIYAQYADDIAAALENEKDPEFQSSDTAAWRNAAQRKPVSPLANALAKEFDLNLHALRNYVYYSVIIMVFAYFGTPGNQASSLPLLIPILWVSKLRQLRLITKFASYLWLQLLPRLDFLLPLFPAPLQVLAQLHKSWSDDSEKIQEVDR